MGVRDLWCILDPISEETTLQHLQIKSVAVDLSGWICENNAVGQCRNIQRPDLRNTFFRASRLALSNVNPVFILEGEAPKIKYSTIRHRNATQGRRAASSQANIPRSQFNTRLNPMIKLLDAMGLTYVRSSGEAEKLCAYLNTQGIVDAVVSQDSDCFLYGATLVLRNFSVAHGKATARSYSILRVQNELRLNREKLIVLALLLGCDYGQQGVHRVGRTQAIQYLNGLSESPLKRIRSWRTDPHLINLENERIQMSQAHSCSMCWHPGTERKHTKQGCSLCSTETGCHTRRSVLQSQNPAIQWQILELQIRAKALQDLNFPSEEVINEFLKEEKLCNELKIEWKQPNIQQLLNIGTQLLGWEREDCLQKALQLVSRWQCCQLSNKLCPTLPLQLSQLVKKRIQQGEQCIEVQWAPISEFNMQAEVTTVEPITTFSKAYPEQWAKFEESKVKVSKKKIRSHKVKSRDIILQPTPHNQMDVLEEMMEQLELDESVAEHELSDIIFSIVNRGAQ